MITIIIEYIIRDGKQEVCIVLPADMPKKDKAELKYKLSRLLNEGRFSFFAKKFPDSADGSCRIDCGDKYEYHVYEGIIAKVLECEEHSLRFTNKGVVGLQVAITDDQDGSIVKISFPKDTALQTVIDVESEVVDHRELRKYNPKAIISKNKQDKSVTIRTSSKIPDAAKDDAIAAITAYVKEFYKAEPKHPRLKLKGRWF